MTAKEHWEQVYQHRDPTAVSWYQPDPHLSFQLISRVSPNRADPIIDVGGGTSLLIDRLVGEGYSNLTVLDISGVALDIARKRLGTVASRVQWVEADVLEFDPPQAYAVWHDRAVFHFLTAVSQRRRYVQQVARATRTDGHVIVATFSDDGPTKCSGLDVMRYEPGSLHREFGTPFELLESHREQHVTPAGHTQSFVYCLCRSAARH